MYSEVSLTSLMLGRVPNECSHIDVKSFEKRGWSLSRTKDELAIDAKSESVMTAVRRSQSVHERNECPEMINFFRD